MATTGADALNDLPDAELLRLHLAREDNGAAFEVLTRRHAGWIRATAERRLAQSEAAGSADDVVQAVMLLLHRRADPLSRGGRPVAGWLYRATRLACAELQRAAGRRRRRELEAGAHMRSTDDPAEARTLLAELREQLDACVDRLRERDREAIVLRFYQGLSLESAGAALGLNADAARKRVSRALDALRVALAKQGVVAPSATIGTAVLLANASPANGATIAATIASVAEGARGSAAGNAAASTAWTRRLAGTAVAASIAASIAAAAWLAGATESASPKRFAPSGPAISSTQLSDDPFPAVPVPADEARVTGVTVLAVTRVALDGDAFDDLVRATQPTESPGVRRGSSADVFASLRRSLVRGPGVMDAGGVTHYAADRGTIERNEWIAWGEEELERVVGDDVDAVSLRLARSEPTGVRFNAAGSVELRIDEPGMVAISQRHRVSPRMRQAVNVPLKFDGAIAPGESALVMHEFPRLLGRRFAAAFVYQAYRVAPEQQVLIAGVRWAEPWLHVGPAGARSLADRAIRWAGGKKLNPDSVPAEWTRNLANGATVKLMAVSRPARWPFCWWDAGGAAVVNDWTNLSVALNAEQAIAFHLDGVSAAAGERNAFRIPGDATSVELWVGAGDYREQLIREGDEVKLDADATVRFARFAPGDEARVYLTGDAGPDVEFTVDAITPAGERIADDFDRSVELVTEETPRWSRHEPALPLRGRQVDHFVLRWRKREVAAFENWPSVPKRPPGADD